MAFPAAQTRRQVGYSLATSAILCAAVAGSATIARADDRPLVGAIRWDAWQDPTYCQPIVESTLGPQQFHFRVPFFTQVVSPTQVSFQNANTQATMDQEIAYAKQAGLDYWAFDIYPADYGLSNGLKLYLSSSHKSDINFAMTLQGSWMVSENWSTEVTRYVNYFEDVSYQKVEGNRPLVYIFQPEGMISTQFPTWASASAALDQLKQATTAAGLGAPYIVLQGASSATIQGLNGEALGDYAYAGGSLTGSPYSNLAAAVHSSWNNQALTGKNVVPLVSSGWDPRPRTVTPNPWSSYYDGTYYNTATAPEIGAHLLDAMTWTAKNRDVAPADTVLTYAWNEHDEGGWLCPTLNGDGSINTSRIDAVHQAISQFEAGPHIIPLVNGSFERVTPNLSNAWYVAPAGGVDKTTFGWTASDGSNYAGRYLVLNSIAAHFNNAVEGTQALNLPSGIWTQQSPEAAQAQKQYNLSFWLCTSQYMDPSDPTKSYFGHPQARVEAQILAGNTIIADNVFISPESWGAWQQYTLNGVTDAYITGDLTIRFMAMDPISGQYEGIAIMDDVMLTSQPVPEPAMLGVVATFGWLATRRPRRFD